jgi:hypothetical protein
VKIYSSFLFTVLFILVHCSQSPPLLGTGSTLVISPSPVWCAVRRSTIGILIPVNILILSTQNATLSREVSSRNTAKKVLTFSTGTQANSSMLTRMSCFWTQHLKKTTQPLKNITRMSGNDRKGLQVLLPIKWQDMHTRLDVSNIN